jgi:hypothetical protein
MIQRLLTGANRAPEAWTGRLESVGAALDRYPQLLTSIAISITGDTVLVSALEWHDGSRISGWMPVTFRIESGEAIPLPSAGDLAEVVDRSGL